MATHLLAACAMLKRHAEDDSALETLLQARLDRLEGKALVRHVEADGTVTETFQHTPQPAQQKPSAVIERVKDLMTAINRNEASLCALDNGRLIVDTTPYYHPSSDVTKPSSSVSALDPAASHVSVIRSIKSQGASANVQDQPDRSFPSPQQLIDAAQPGDTIVLRPGHLYTDVPLKITTPFITIRGGGRKIQRSSSKAAPLSSYHTITLPSVEAADVLVSKADTVLLNSTDKAAISIQAVGVKIEGLKIFQLTREAPAVAVHVNASQLVEMPGHYGVALSLTTVGPSSSLGHTAIIINHCDITSVNCHAIHATNTFAEDVGQAEGPGGLDIRDCHIQSTHATGIQLGLLNGGGSGPQPTSSTLPKAIPALPPKVHRCIIESVTMTNCGISGIALLDPRCELLRVSKCTIKDSGRYGIHFSEVAAPPSSIAAGKVSRASSALRRPGSAALSRAIVGGQAVDEYGDASLLRAYQNRYSATVSDTLIKDPKVCAIVIEAGRIISQLIQTTAILTEPNSVGLYLHGEGSLLKAESNCL